MVGYLPEKTEGYVGWHNHNNHWPMRGSSETTASHYFWLTWENSEKNGQCGGWRLDQWPAYKNAQKKECTKWTKCRKIALTAFNYNHSTQFPDCTLQFWNRISVPYFYWAFYKVIMSALITFSLLFCLHWKRKTTTTTTTATKRTMQINKWTNSMDSRKQKSYDLVRDHRSATHFFSNWITI